MQAPTIATSARAKEQEDQSTGNEPRGAPMKRRNQARRTFGIVNESVAIQDRVEDPRKRSSRNEP